MEGSLVGSLEMARLLKLIEDGIRVLRTLEGVPVSDAQCEERANGIGAQLLGNYLVVELPAEPVEAEAPEWWTPLIEGRPVGHSWSCRCDRCDTYKRSTKERS